MGPVLLCCCCSAKKVANLCLCMLILCLQRILPRIVRVELAVEVFVVITLEAMASAPSPPQLSTPSPPQLSTSRHQTLHTRKQTAGRFSILKGKAVVLYI